MCGGRRACLCTLKGRFLVLGVQNGGFCTLAVRVGGALFYQWCHVSSTVLLPDDFVGRIVSSVVSWRAMRNDLDPFLGGVDWIFAI